MTTRTEDQGPPASAGCESCGMPIESGRYCSYCTDADGRLQPFEERFERMVDWQARRDPAASRAEVETATRAHLRSMPAWRDHPALAVEDTPPADAR
jgi:hypothetical protein